MHWNDFVELHIADHREMQSYQAKYKHIPAIGSMQRATGS